MICKYCGGTSFHNTFYTCSECNFFYFANEIRGVNIDLSGKIYFLYSTANKKLIFYNNGIYEYDMEYKYTNEQDLMDILIRLKDNMEFM